MEGVAASSLVDKRLYLKHCLLKLLLLLPLSNLQCVLYLIDIDILNFYDISLVI